MKTKKCFFTAIIAVCATSVLNLSCSQAEEAMTDFVDEASTATIDKEAVENADILMGIGVHDSEDPVIVSTIANSDVISFDSLMTICKEEFTEWSSGAKKKAVVKQSKTQTAVGFSNSSYQGSYKVLLSAAQAKAFSIPQDVYIMEVCTFYYYLAVPGLGTTVDFVHMSSPNCGLDPLTGAVGYCSSLQTNLVTMATIVFYINCNLAGVTYGLWTPRLPVQLEWNYRLIDHE